MRASTTLLVVRDVNSLYHNNGDETFNRDETAGLSADRAFADACAWADYDDDGDMDVVVASWQTYPNSLFFYRNNGDATFTRNTEGPVTLCCSYVVNGVVWGDCDNDGRVDLVVVPGNGPSGWNSPCYIFHNEGDGSFTQYNVSPGIGVDAQLVDFDNDGDLDIYICRQAANPNALQPNILHRNNGDGTFTPVLTCRLSTDTARSLGAAWGDYDNNGFPDVYVCNFETSYPNALYRNEGNGNNWIVFKLIGTASNRSAIGAKVRVEAIIGDKAVWQRRDISGGGGWGQNDLRAHFGLRDATEAKTVRIEWPSGIVQELYNVPAGQLHTVTEPVYDYPLIMLQPRSAVVPAGTNVSLRVAAYSPLPMTYQWQLYGTNLPGATEPVLRLANVYWTQDGPYTVVVRNPNAAVVSDTAQVTVRMKPVILQAPVSQSVVAGGQVTLSVAIDGHPPPFYYLWRRGGTLLGHIESNERQCFLTLRNIQLSDQGLYWLFITNATSPSLAGAFTNWTITVLPDADADGLPDGWETQQGINQSTPQHGMADDDGDGFCNCEEYNAGTSPTDAQSCFRVKELCLTEGGDEVVLRFEAKVNRTYSVEYRAAVDRGDWERLADVVAGATERVVEIRDAEAGRGGHRFYRIVCPRSP